MGYSQKSGGAALASPGQSTTISAGSSSANTMIQTHRAPSIEPTPGYPVSVINAYQQRPDFTPQDCINVSTPKGLLDAMCIS